MRRLFISAVSCLACGLATRPVVAITLAADNASNAPYTDGWQAGDNGGVGFGPWEFDFSGITAGLFHPPQFIDIGPLPGNLLGAPAFGLTTSNRDFFTDTSEVRRTFTPAIGVGQTFSIDVDGSALNPAARVFTTGNTIQLFGTDGMERFGLYTNNNFNNNNWTTTGDVNTGVPANSAFHIDFKLATANTYDLAILPIDGGSPLFTRVGAMLNGTAGTAINSLRISAYGTGSSADGSKELFFDNLAVTGPGIFGDYNQNGAVDAADYVVWRRTFGQTGTGLPADGNRNNQIDAGDYTVWRANFGLPGVGTGSTAQVAPEPSSWLMFITGFGLLCRLFNTAVGCRK